MVNAFINQHENWQVNNQNNRIFVFFEKTCSGISIPWFFNRPSIDHAIEKSQRKGSTHPHPEVDRALSHRVQPKPSLAEFQQWSELQAQVYDKVNRENPTRNTIPSSKKFGNSIFNANTAYRNYTLQLLNSLVVNQERSQRHQLQQNLQPQSTNSSPRSFNANRSCEKCKINHSLAACPEYQLCPPSGRYSIVSKNSLCTIFLAIITTNSHVRQLNDAMYAVVSNKKHCMTQQSKSNFQQQFFQQKTHKKHQPTVPSDNKTAVESTINNSQAKGQLNKNSNSRYGQSFNGQNQNNPQRRNLNGSSNSQSFCINQSPDAPKNW